MSIFFVGIFVFACLKLSITVLLIPDKKKINSIGISILNKIYSISNIQYYLTAVYGMIGILLLDNCWTIYKMDNSTHSHHSYDDRFFAQRNIYLCGMTLILPIAIYGLYSKITHISRIEAELEQARAQMKAEREQARERERGLNKKDE